MQDNGFAASAILGLLLFLGLNYATGYVLGEWLTGSFAASVALALAMPGVTVVLVALLAPAPRRYDRRVEG